MPPATTRRRPLAPGAWSVQPRIVGSWNAAVTSLDAAWVLQSVAGLRSLDATQSLACDVTANGAVTSLDAARLLQFAVGLRPRLPAAEACASDWLFVPEPALAANQSVTPPQLQNGSCVPGAIVLAPLVADAPSQDFAAIVIGDCTGNWTP